MYLFYRKSGIITCVLLQNIVVVYRDIFVPLYRKSGITRCVLLQNVVVVYRDLFVPFYRISGITTCVHLQNIVVVFCDMFVPLYRKSGKAEAQNQMGQSVTHASIQPTQSPSWEEILVVEFREENSKDEGWLSGKFCSFLCPRTFVLKL